MFSFKIMVPTNYIRKVLESSNSTCGTLPDSHSWPPSLQDLLHTGKALGMPPAPGHLPYFTLHKGFNFKGFRSGFSVKEYRPRGRMVLFCFIYF